MAKVGVLGYGVYIPRERIQSELVLRARESGHPKLRNRISRLQRGLLLKNKAIASIYEDSATLAYEAASNALRMSGVYPEDIGAVIVGTEDKPYAVKTIATQVGSWVGAGKRKHVFDIECACNGGIEAIAIVKAFVASRSMECGIGIGTDVSGAPKKDDLEYAVGAGAVGGVVGRGTDDELIGELFPGIPYSSDYTDFWRREGQKHPSHFGPTTADAYIEHVGGAVIGVLEKYPKIPLAKFDHIAPHEPNGYMPKKAFRAFVPEQIEKIKSKPEDKRSPADKASLKIDELLELKGLKDRARLTDEDIKTKLEPNLKPVLEIGNTYAAQTGIVLSYILDRAKPYEKVLVVSYGSGAQALGAPFEVLPGIEEKRGIVPSVQDYIDRMVKIRINTYKTLFKERMKRWSARHLVSRKIVGDIEPAKGNKEFYDISICKQCGAIYTPGRNCLNAKHKPSEVTHLAMPKKARLKKFTVHSLRKSLRKRASDIMLKDKVILVDCKAKDLELGMELEPVIRRVDHDGKAGLIHYTWAYRPLFRDSEQYLARAELSRAKVPQTLKS